MTYSNVLAYLLNSREVRHLALLAVLFCCSGATCSRSFQNRFASVGPPAPEILLTGATLEQVATAINQNVAKIQTYQTNNASITIPGTMSLPLLRGNLAADQAGKLRLQASTALTGPEVDLGSNQELFWFWLRRNNPPHIFYCRHDQFVGSAAQQMMPIEPSWLLDALGFAQLKPTDHHEEPVPHGNGTLEIRSMVQSRVGTLTKSTVVEASRAWILEQHLYDQTGTLLASSIAKSHRYYPEFDVSLPQEIELRLPMAQLSLSINLGTIELNQPIANQAIWQLPVMSGYAQYDLGGAPPGSFAPTQSAENRDLGALDSSSSLQGTPSQLASRGTSPQSVGSPNPYAAATATTGAIPSVAENQESQPATLRTEYLPRSSQPVTQQLPAGGVQAVWGE